MASDCATRLDRRHAGVWALSAVDCEADSDHGARFRRDMLDEVAAVAALRAGIGFDSAHYSTQGPITWYLLVEGTDPSPSPVAAVAAELSHVCGGQVRRWRAQFEEVATVHRSRTLNLRAVHAHWLDPLEVAAELCAEPGMDPPTVTLHPRLGYGTWSAPLGLLGDATFATLYAGQRCNARRPALYPDPVPHRMWAARLEGGNTSALRWARVGPGEAVWRAGSPDELLDRLRDDLARWSSR